MANSLSADMQEHPVRFCGEKQTIQGAVELKQELKLRGNHVALTCRVENKKKIKPL